MICKMCHKPFYVPATEIKISNYVDKILNRTIRACPKCAYSIVEKCIETEPFNKKCNQG